MNALPLVAPYRATSVSYTHLAALVPQPNEEAKDAYFFVTDLKGSYYYARTLSEHSANCQKAA